MATIANQINVYIYNWVQFFNLTFDWFTWWRGISQVSTFTAQLLEKLQYREKSRTRERVRVRWIDCGRSTGKESYVVRNNICKEGTLRNSQKVRVRWGKCNRYYSAEVAMDEDQETPQSQASETTKGHKPRHSHEETPTRKPPKKGTKLPTDVFTFELGWGTGIAVVDNSLSSVSPLSPSTKESFEASEDSLRYCQLL